MDINPLDYTISSLNKLQLKKGRLLIAEPFMSDPNFKRSVVLLTEYTQDECLGFIINQPLNIKLNEVLNDFPPFETSICMGGPVATDNLFFIHTQGDFIEGSQKINEHLWWSGNFEQLKTMINNNEIFPHEIKFFLGYAGWDYLQLKNEIKEGSWIISDSENLSLNDFDNNQLWQKTLEDMGGKYAILSNFPSDPNLN